MRNFLKKIFRRPAPAASVRPLVKKRPASLETQYTLAPAGELGDEFFLRLKRQVYAALDAGKVTAHREAGKLASGRPYFYVKPFNQSGWLFERSESGWIIAQAEKLSQADTFLRDQLIFDQASVFVPDHPARLPRVRSQVVGDELISVALYESRILETLGFKAKVAEPPGAS